MQTALDTWLAKLQKARLPALRTTQEAVARLAGDEKTPMDRLASAVESDPGLSSALMRTIHALGHKHLRSEVTTIEHALMMLGVDRVRALPRAVPALETVKEALAARQLRHLYTRTLLAARLAREVALLRRDMAPDEVYLAALLHHLAEALLWVEAPKKMLEVEIHTWHHGREREEAEYVVLGCSLTELTRALARHWGLPSLVERSLHPEQAENPRIFALLLSVQLARHAAHGWYRPQVSAVMEQLAEFLRMERDELIPLLHEAAVDAARGGPGFGVPAIATWLLLGPGEEVPPDLPLPASPPPKPAAEEPSGEADLCLAPNQTIYQAALEALTRRDGELSTARAVRLALEALHEGLGLNRVVLAILNPERNRLHARNVVGADDDPLFGRFAVDLDGVNLFVRLLDKPQALWLNDENRPRLWPMMPLALYRVTRTNEFYAMSLFVRGRPVGLFYADRHTGACHLTDHHYAQFKRVVQETAAAMTWLSERRT